MKRLGLILVGVTTLSWSQTPDFSLRIDLRLHYTTESGGGAKLRWYDPMGRHSVVGFGLNLEPGYYLLVTERLQKVAGDIDREQIDEAYVEDPGRWRLGRQYLPFGDRTILREAALAARFDQDFTRNRIPVTVAAFDNGKNLLRGVLVRVGSPDVGLSASVGEHLGAASTSLGPFRSPESSPGPGRGYRVAGGAHISRPWGPARVTGEYVGFRRPHDLAQDRSEDLTDLRFTYTTPDGLAQTTIGWARVWRERNDFYRVEGQLKLTKNLDLRSFVRFNRGEWKDFSIGIRVRI